MYIRNMPQPLLIKWDYYTESTYTYAHFIDQNIELTHKATTTCMLALTPSHKASLQHKVFDSSR